MKYIYLDREYAKQGLSMVYATSDTKRDDYEEYFEGKAIEFQGDDLPHFITYVEDGDTIRSATDSERVANGTLELGEGQVLIDDIVTNYDPIYSKIVDNTIVEKTISELEADGVISRSEMKEELLVSVTDLRDTIREYATVSFDGHLQRYRKLDLSDIDFYQRQLEKAQIKAQASENALAIEEGREAEEIILKMNWNFYDGSKREVTVDDFDSILALTFEPIQELYDKESALKEMITNITDIEELANFDVTMNWAVV
jgi:hypothetical protein